MTGEKQMTRVDQTNEVHQISGELLGAYGKLVIGLAKIQYRQQVAAGGYVLSLRRRQAGGLDG